MTGLLTLSGEPTANLHAATKAYVDSTASSSDAAFIETAQTLNTDKTISTNVNAACVGPMALASGVTLTVSANSKLVVLT